MNGLVDHANKVKIGLIMPPYKGFSTDECVNKVKSILTVSNNSHMFSNGQRVGNCAELASRNRLPTWDWTRRTWKEAGSNFVMHMNWRGPHL